MFLNSSLELNNSPLKGSLYFACNDGVHRQLMNNSLAHASLTLRPEISAYFLIGFKGGGASRLLTVL